MRSHDQIRGAKPPQIQPRSTFFEGGKKVSIMPWLFSRIIIRGRGWWCRNANGALWFKTRWNWDIKKYTFPRAREWAKWASERTSERSGGRERSEQCGARERMSSASERANGQASGPVLSSGFLIILAHSVSGVQKKKPVFWHFQHYQDYPE